MKKILIICIIALLITTLFLPIAQAKSHKYTTYEINVISRVVYAESRNQPFLGKAAVALTVINRLESGKYGKSIDHITRRSQFCKAAKSVVTSKKMSVKKAFKACKDAVVWAITHRVLPSNTYYFQRSKRMTWKGRPRIKRYTRIGSHSFYTLDKAKPVVGIYLNSAGKLVMK